MGARSGGLTFRVFKVVEKPARDFREEYSTRLNKNSFREINPADDKERSLGWVTLSNALDTSFNPEKFLYNEYICLTLRVDSLKVPNPILSLYFVEELKKFQAKKGGKISKAEREEIKHKVKMQLRARLLPNIQRYDVAWNTNTDCLFFWGTSKRLVDDFIDLFEKTFDFSPIPLGPFTLCAKKDLSELDKFADLAESKFF